MGADAAAPMEVVEATLETFTKLDLARDERAMNKLARRLGKEQPALLQYAARTRERHGDAAGEAAVFYATLVWAMFDRMLGKSLPQLGDANLAAAAEVVATEIGEVEGSAGEPNAQVGEVEGSAGEPIAQRIAPGLRARQPHLVAKLAELIAEDVAEEAISTEVAGAIFPLTQTVVEAFDAAIAGRRPGLRLGPVVRHTPKVGRNEPCPCGSGKKFKKCCGAA